MNIKVMKKKKVKIKKKKKYLIKMKLVNQREIQKKKIAKFTQMEKALI
jgi:hypothetical protein